MRLGDLDALKKAIDDYAEKRQDTLLWQADIEELIDNAPKIEIYCPYLSDEEIKQPCLEGPCKGPKGKFVKMLNERIEKSVCKFCPFCGARMGGET